jgi:hypothetical protein
MGPVELLKEVEKRGYQMDKYHKKYEIYRKKLIDSVE